MAERKRISEEEWLYRRGYSKPEKNYMNPDGTATSRVFKLREKDEGELSVDVKSMTTPEKAIGDAGRFFLFELPNRAILKISIPQLATFHAPLPGNDAHAVIVGMTMDDEITPGLLAKASKRIFL